jgi:hypothetical protein
MNKDSKKILNLNQILSIDKHKVLINLNIIIVWNEIKQRVLTDMKSKSNLNY